MQATLTIGDDLAVLLEEERRRRGVSLKEVVNAALRRGLAQEEPPTARAPVVIRTHDFGFLPEFDSVNFNHFANQLEDEEIMAKMRKGS